MIEFKNVSFCNITIDQYIYFATDCEDNQDYLIFKKHRHPTVLARIPTFLIDDLMDEHELDPLFNKQVSIDEWVKRQELFIIDKSGFFVPTHYGAVKNILTNFEYLDQKILIEDFVIEDLLAID